MSTPLISIEQVCRANLRRVERKLSRLEKMKQTTANPAKLLVRMESAHAERSAWRDELLACLSICGVPH